MVKFIIKYHGDIISVLSLFVAIVSTFFGRLSYKTAQNIYKNGIQNDCKSIYSQLGLEIVWNIVIPFRKFKNIMQDVLNEEKLEQEKVETVYKVLDSCRFKISTPYWNLHKGEIWDAIEKDTPKKKFWKNKTKPENEEDIRFVEIQDFFKKAEEFERGVQKICNAMENYLYPKETGKSNNNPENSNDSDDPKDTIMEVFLGQKRNSNIYQKSNEKMQELDRAIDKLPVELEIEKKYKRITGKH